MFSFFNFIVNCDIISPIHSCPALKFCHSGLCAKIIGTCRDLIHNSSIKMQNAKKKEEYHNEAIVRISKLKINHVFTSKMLSIPSCQQRHTFKKQNQMPEY